jgi:hypothetical protein
MAPAEIAKLLLLVILLLVIILAALLLSFDGVLAALSAHPAAGRHVDLKLAITVLAVISGFSSISLAGWAVFRRMTYGRRTPERPSED